MTPDLVTFSGEFVTHKSIKILETEVTRVGSLINWLRLYTLKMFFRKEEMRASASRNKLQLTSPSIYNFLFSASILAKVFQTPQKVRLGMLYVVAY